MTVPQGTNFSLYAGREVTRGTSNMMNALMLPLVWRLAGGVAQPLL